MAKILALVDNFLFKVKIGETAKQYGIDVDFWTGEARKDLLEYDAIIIDANFKGANAQNVLKMLPQAAKSKVICYLNHIQTDLAKDIRSLGVETVWPQSLFVKKLPEILSKLSQQ